MHFKYRPDIYFSKLSDVGNVAILIPHLPTLGHPHWHQFDNGLETFLVSSLSWCIVIRAGPVAGGTSGKAACPCPGSGLGPTASWFPSAAQLEVYLTRTARTWGASLAGPGAASCRRLVELASYRFWQRDLQDLIISCSTSGSPAGRVLDKWASNPPPPRCYAWLKWDPNV